MKPVNIIKVYQILGRFTRRFHLPLVDALGKSHRTPFKILMITMLSARTNDKTTAKIAPKLFKRIRKVKDLEKISQRELEHLIYPVGFYKTKARMLKQWPKHIKGRIPDTIEQLTKIPGVGRKTANLVEAQAFHKPAICVDTHVHKIMNRLGYLKTSNATKTEQILRKKLPKRLWSRTNMILVAFGQNWCTPRNPKCKTCPIRKYCNRVGLRKV
ncbi:MAG: endonuclease III [Candidatus Woesearchaeota archaeon]